MPENKVNLPVYPYPLYDLNQNLTCCVTSYSKRYDQPSKSKEVFNVLNVTSCF